MMAGMKKLILIFVVFLILVGAIAHFTRPQDPRLGITALLQKQAKLDPALAQISDMAVAKLTDGLEVRDRFFWVTVRKDDKVVCHGAFTQWFFPDELELLKAANELNALKEKAQAEVGKVEDKIKSVDPKIKLPDAKVPDVKVPGVP